MWLFRVRGLDNRPVNSIYAYVDFAVFLDRSLVIWGVTETMASMTILYHKTSVLTQVMREDERVGFVVQT